MKTSKIYAISAYLSSNRGNAIVLDRLSRAFDRLRGSNIIIGLDANAHSTMWGSQETDTEGETIELFIAQHNLCTINQPGQPTTFQSNWGSSNIDITLASWSLRLGVQNWLVGDGWTLSDHRVIQFEISLDTAHPIPSIPPPNQIRYKSNLRDYKRFNIKFRQNSAGLTPPPTTSEDINTFVNDLEQAIHLTANEVLKKPVLRQKTVPWWSRDLARLRKSAHTARRHFQRSSDNTREIKRLEYVAKKKTYVQAVRRAKRENT